MSEEQRAGTRVSIKPISPAHVFRALLPETLKPQAHIKTSKNATKDQEIFIGLDYCTLW